MLDPPAGDIAQAGAAAPIGVFDSGVGGLTVLGAIHRRLPREATIYLGDTARVPYGPKSAETIRRYAAEAAAFFVEFRAKAIVVACNTATARALPIVAERSGLPVLGVIEPGARAAAARSLAGHIGVIGTRGTIESGAYDAAILRMRPDATVIGVACPLFVALAEEGWTDGDVADLVARRYLDPLLAEGIDTLVLGCTHYPLLRPLLQEVAGKGVALVDSAEATATDLEPVLASGGLLRGADGSAGAAGADGSAGAAGAHPEAASRRYFATDDPGRFEELASRFLGERIDRVEPVSLDGR